MALLTGGTVPTGAQDAFLIVELECHPTLAELDSMPQKLIETILLYKSVKGIVEHGGKLVL